MSAAGAATTGETVFEVDPARLAAGAWRRCDGARVGEGDIAASYSGDRIGMGRPIRKPFEWRGQLWTNVGGWWKDGDVTAKAYRLVPLGRFENPTTYSQRAQDGDRSRADPNGFYHGVAVRCGKEEYALCGPPALFVAGEPAQLELF